MFHEVAKKQNDCSMRMTVVQLRSVHIVFRARIFDFGEKLLFDAVCYVRDGSSIPGKVRRLSFTIAAILSKRWMFVVMLRTNQVLFPRFRFTCRETRILLRCGTTMNKFPPPHWVQANLGLLRLKLLKQPRLWLLPTTIGYWSRNKRAWEVVRNELQVGKVICGSKLNYSFYESYAVVWNQLSTYTCISNTSGQVKWPSSTIHEKWGSRIYGHCYILRWLLLHKWQFQKMYIEKGSRRNLMNIFEPLHMVKGKSVK